MDVVAGSAIPINVIDATAFLSQTNLITIGSGAVVESAGDIKLHAERFGTPRTLIGKATAVTWATELLGNDEQFKGTSSSAATGTVTNNGTIRTGLKRNQVLVLDAWDRQAGTVTASTQTGGIEFKVGVEQVQSNLSLALIRAQRQLNTYKDSDAALKSFYAGEVTRLQDTAGGKRPVRAAGRVPRGHVNNGSTRRH